MGHFSSNDVTEYVECLADNAALIRCLDVCPSTGGEACQSACRAALPDQLDHTGCLGVLPNSDVVTACGPYQAPRSDQVKIMSPHDPRTVTLGDDDIKAGLWSQWIDRPSPPSISAVFVWAAELGVTLYFR